MTLAGYTFRFERLDLQAKGNYTSEKAIVALFVAGYTFRFERLDLQAKGNYTSEKAIVALFDHQQRIGELTPERRFYEALRQQMMEPSIRWTGIHDWYAVMGE